MSHENTMVREKKKENNIDQEMKWQYDFFQTLLLLNCINLSLTLQVSEPKCNTIVYIQLQGWIQISLRRGTLQYQGVTLLMHNYSKSNCSRYWNEVAVHFHKLLDIFCTITNCTFIIHRHMLDQSGNCTGQYPNCLEYVRCLTRLQISRQSGWLFY